jgi:hypothetical protein
MLVESERATGNHVVRTTGKCRPQSLARSNDHTFDM